MPEPRKRPRSSYVRLEAAQPNETCQSDVSHWRLADGTNGEAKLWRQDAQVDLRRGAIEAAKPLTISQAAERWTKGARAGTIRNRSGEIYKPSVLRGYEQALRDYILPALGGCRLNELQRGDVQRLADRLVEAGHGASTVRNAFLPLRAICRRALTRGDILVNPTIGIELPAVRGKRDRIAGPDEAARLGPALRSLRRFAPRYPG